MDPDKDLRQIAETVLASAEPSSIIRKCMHLEGDLLRITSPAGSHQVNLANIDKVFVLGFGKASGPMALAVEGVLGSRIAKGLIVVKPGHETRLERIGQVVGGHPIPDAQSERAAADISALADEADDRTLVIVLISGGGSSLLAAPLEQSGITLMDLQETTRALLACGATIGEMNCIRKHLFLHAGGKLALKIAPAASVSLVLSDVVGNDVQTIASGPTCADTTTYDDALSIIRNLGIGEILPRAVMECLRGGVQGKYPETPKPGSPNLALASTFVIGTNFQALRDAANTARRLGYNPIVLSSQLAGESREVAKVLAAVAKEIASSGIPVARPACVLAGGETTVTLRGKGRGGRNQELALAFLIEMQRELTLLSGTHFLSYSTDGEDGPTDAAGGYATNAMVRQAATARLRLPEALWCNDSYTVLKKLNGLFMTGPTNTNVCDVQIALVL